MARSKNRGAAGIAGAIAHGGEPIEPQDEEIKADDLPPGTEIPIVAGGISGPEVKGVLIAGKPAKGIHPIAAPERVVLDEDDAASDQVAVPCLVTITAGVKPFGAKRVSLHDARRNEHWFTRGGKAADATNRMIIPPPVQRQLRTESWLVVKE